jgi:hypothetical protein
MIHTVTGYSKPFLHANLIAAQLKIRPKMCVTVHFGSRIYRACNAPPPLPSFFLLLQSTHNTYRRVRGALRVDGVHAEDSVVRAKAALPRGAACDVRGVQGVGV